MNFAEKYFKRFNALPKQIEGSPKQDLEVIAVIPCSNEPDLIQSLASLDACQFSGFSAEVICVINSSEIADESLKAFNKETFMQAKEAILGFTNPNLKFHFLLHDNLPKKFAGVGLARKIGMDEAVRRFAALNKPNGIITGYDADSLTDKNYFAELFKQFSQNPKMNAASLYYEHPLVGNDFEKGIYEGITAYELHLRYFNQALKRAGFPFAYHTVGSSFAVRANIYAAQGGMNRKKAGEDFYFLQKIIPLGNFGELNSIRIIPSPRTSDRVPFGTGAALAKMSETNNFGFLTYNFSAFEDLKSLFSRVSEYYTNDITDSLPLPLKDFLSSVKISEKLPEMRKNSTDLASFQKRFYAFFDAFRIIRFLNISHESHYSKSDTSEASLLFFSKYFTESSTLQELKSDNNSIVEKNRIALTRFREVERFLNN